MDEFKLLESMVGHESIEVVSFDLFDTLLARPAVVASDVFFLLDRRARSISGSTNLRFSTARVRAEDLARRKLEEQDPDYGEVTLDQIYEAFASDQRVSSQAAEQLKAEELDLERKLLRPRFRVQRIFAAALRAGKRIVVTSDTYLPKAFLAELLRSKGFDGFQEIYASSESKRRKSTGALFDYMLADLGVSAEAVLHIGDNRESDFAVPRSKGIPAFFCPSALERFERTSRLQGRILEGLKEADSKTRLILGLCLNSLESRYNAEWMDASVFQSSSFLLGYFGLGPILFAVACALLDVRIQSRYRRIGFAARDGMLPMKAYEIMTEGRADCIPAKYLYCSRHSYAIHGYEGDPLAFAFSKRNRVEGTTIGAWLDAVLGQDHIETLPFLRQELAAEDLKKALEPALPRLRKIFGAHRAELAQALEERRSLAETYFKTELEPTQGHASLVFDLGYGGSAGLAIGSLLGAPVDKVYLQQNEANIALDRKLGTATHVILGPKTRKVANHSHGGMILEALFSPAAGSCLGYSRGTDGRIEPVLDSADYIGDEMRGILGQAQEAALRFVRDAREELQDYIPDFGFEATNGLLLPMEAMISETPREDIELLSSFAFKDHREARSLQPLVETIFRDAGKDQDWGMANLVSKPVVGREGRRDRGIQREPSIAIHVHLYYPEVMPELIAHLEGLPYPFDLFITVISAADLKLSRMAFESSRAPNLRKLNVSLVPNRGRDVAPWILGVGADLQGYDLACHLHTKRSDPSYIGNDWRRFLYDNLISREAASDIIELFEKNPKLGLVFPTPYWEIYAKMKRDPSATWRTKSAQVQALAERAGSTSQVRIKKLAFSVGTMFWYRPPALASLFALDLALGEFAPEPLDGDESLPYVVEKAVPVLVQGCGYEQSSYLTPAWARRLVLGYYGLDLVQREAGSGEARFSRKLTRLAGRLLSRRAPGLKRRLSRLWRWAKRRARRRS
jgi:HAD superfamily hydrolase (TIGR01549 family)